MGLGVGDPSRDAAEHGLLAHPQDGRVVELALAALRAGAGRREAVLAGERAREASGGTATWAVVALKEHRAAAALDAIDALVQFAVGLRPTQVGHWLAVEKANGAGGEGAEGEVIAIAEGAAGGEQRRQRVGGDQSQPSRRRGSSRAGGCPGGSHG